MTSELPFLSPVAGGPCAQVSVVVGVWFNRSTSRSIYPGRVGLPDGDNYLSILYTYTYLYLYEQALVSL